MSRATNCWVTSPASSLIRHTNTQFTAKNLAIYCQWLFVLYSTIIKQIKCIFQNSRKIYSTRWPRPCTVLILGITQLITTNEGQWVVLSNRKIGTVSTFKLDQNLYVKFICKVERLLWSALYFCFQWVSLLTCARRKYLFIKYTQFFIRHLWNSRLQVS